MDQTDGDLVHGPGYNGLDRPLGGVKEIRSLSTRNQRRALSLTRAHSIPVHLDDVFLAV